MKSKEEIINEIASRDYYDTVAYGFIEEAVEQVLELASKPMTVDEIDNEIRENYI